MESLHADNTDFSEFVRSFGEATARLQETHAALKKQVERLQNELAEANERLRRSRSLAALGEMAAGIAHEIRNPLGAIALNAEMLQDDVADRPESAASVDKIRRAHRPGGEQPHSQRRRGDARIIGARNRVGRARGSATRC